MLKLFGHRAAIALVVVCAAILPSLSEAASGVDLKPATRAESQFVFDELKGKCVSEKDPEVTGYNKVGLKPCLQMASKKLVESQVRDLDLRGSRFAFTQFINVQFMKVRGSHMDLRQSILNRSSIEDTDFAKANFIGSQFTSVRATKVNLSEARLDGIKVTRSRFKDVNLSDASLKSALLTDTVFEDSILPATIKSQAILINVKFENCRFQ